jgi:hypothetical protein
LRVLIIAIAVKDWAIVTGRISPKLVVHQRQQLTMKMRESRGIEWWNMLAHVEVGFP